MSFYLLLLLGWSGSALVAAMLMGRFIVVGRGSVVEDAEASPMRSANTGKGEAARPGKREAA